MARARRAPQDTQTQTTRSGHMAGTAITPDMIAELLAKGRSRGDYESFLREFLDSEEAGWEVPLDSGPFAGKTAKQVKTSFDNARKRLGDDGKAKIDGGTAVKVIVADDKAYLINTNVPVAS
jgi:hypothetical protein